jgi:hypothetical protein
MAVSLFLKLNVFSTCINMNCVVHSTVHLIRVHKYLAKQTIVTYYLDWISSCEKVSRINLVIFML